MRTQLPLWTSKEVCCTKKQVCSSGRELGKRIPVVCAANFFVAKGQQTFFSPIPLLPLSVPRPMPFSPMRTKSGKADRHLVAWRHRTIMAAPQRTAWNKKMVKECSAHTKVTHQAGSKAWQGYSGAHKNHIMKIVEEEVFKNSCYGERILHKWARQRCG